MFRPALLADRLAGVFVCSRPVGPAFLDKALKILPMSARQTMNETARINTCQTIAKCLNRPQPECSL